MLILRGTCLFEDKLANAKAAGAVGALVYTAAAGDEPFEMAVTTTFPAEMIGYDDGIKLKQFLETNPNATVALTFTEDAVSVSPWKLSSSSSRGPSMDMLKPELSAVGTNVYTALPSSKGTPGYGVLSGTSFSSPMVAGAVALVKAARPGLAGYQYRSLVIDSASSLTPDGVAAPLAVEAAGNGVLNVGAALKATITSDPAVVSYGVGGPDIKTWRTLALDDISGKDDSYTITVQPLTGSEAPYPVPDSFDLAAGSTRWIPMVFYTTGMAPGEYQGFFTIHSARTGVDLRVPYWYGISSGNAKKILVLQGPDVGSTYRGGSTQWIIFRAIDESGIPVLTDPVITAKAGQGTVVPDSLENIDFDVPGAFAVQVRLSRTAGDNTFTITSGDTTYDVTYTVGGGVAP